MTVTTTRDFDVVVIGAGPVGLYAAYCAGVRGLRTLVLDGLPTIGGQLGTLYPEKPIFDIAGFPRILAKDLVGRLEDQARFFDATFSLSTRVTGLRRLGSFEAAPIVVETADGRSWATGAVVICGGIGSFLPRKLAAVDRFEGRGVGYFVASVEDYRDRDVVIAGGGDSACDWALVLEEIAKSVTVVHRRSEFRAAPATVSALRSSSVRLATNAEILRLIGDDEVEEVEIGFGATTETVAADRVLAALGFVANLGPIKDWGIELTHGRHVSVDSRMLTSVDSVYAAGDIVDYQGKVRLISVGFGEAATAVNNAAAALDPGVDIFPGHSTNQQHQVR